MDIDHCLPRQISIQNSPEASDRSQQDRALHKKSMDRINPFESSDTANTTKEQRRQSPPPAQAADLSAGLEPEQSTKDKATSSTSVTSPSSKDGKHEPQHNMSDMQHALHSAGHGSRKQVSKLHFHQPPPGVWTSQWATAQSAFTTEHHHQTSAKTRVMHQHHLFAMPRLVLDVVRHLPLAHTRLQPPFRQTTAQGANDITKPNSISVPPCVVHCALDADHCRSA